MKSGRMEYPCLFLSCKCAAAAAIFALWLYLWLWGTAFVSHAENVQFLVRSNQSGLYLEKSLFADELFGRPDLIPGESEKGSLTLRNRANQPVYYLIGPVRRESGSEALFNDLVLTVSERSGTVLYKGPLSQAVFPVRTLQAGKSERLLYELSLPLSAGNEAKGQVLDFQLTYLVADNPEALPKPGDGSGGAGDGSGGGSGSEGGLGSGGSSGSGSGSGSENGSDSGGSSSSGSGSDLGAGGGSGNHGSGSVSGGSHGGGSGSEGSGHGGGGSSGGSGHGNGSSSGSFGHGGGSNSGSSSHSGGSVNGNTHVVGTGYIAGGSGSGSASGMSQSSVQQLMIYDHPDFSRTTPLSGGNWILVDSEKQQWKYRLLDGTELAGGFAYLTNPYAGEENAVSWYHFDASGIMSVGWVPAAGDIWYHMHDVSDGMLGSMTLGWYVDGEDQRTYYMNPENGRMQTGWVQIKDGNGPEKSYYFARLEDTYRQNWFFNTSFGRWMYDKLGNRSYGSLYRNEQTPDGSYVGQDGAKQT